MFVVHRPFCYFLLSSGASLIALHSPRRYHVFLLSICVATGVQTTRYLRLVTDHVPVLALMAMFVIIWTMHIHAVLCVEGQGPRGWRQAWKMLFNPRRLDGKNWKAWPERQRDAGDHKQTRDGRIAKLTSPEQIEPAYSSSLADRTTFVFRRLAQVAALMALHFSYQTLVSPLFSRLFQELFLNFASHDNDDPLSTMQTYLRRLSDVTLTETVVRVLLVVDFIMTSYVFDNCFHMVFSIIWVGSGLDTPDEWQAPLFGSIAHTYRVRFFWGKFWHRLASPTYLSWGTLLVRSVLGRRAKGSLTRHMVHGLVFVMSGIVHGVVTWLLGFRCGWWQDVSWFCAQFLAILVEEAVLNAIQRFVGWRLKGRCATMKVFLGRSLGYLWVWGFMFWSMPKWIYPKMKCSS